MRPASILALSIASFGLLPLACTQNFDYFASSQGTGGGASSSSSSSSGMTSSSSSSGGTGCKTDSDCGDQNECTTDTCDTATGKCSNPAVPDGAPPGYTDTTADCQTEKCVSGVATMVPSDGDVPQSTSQCVVNSCNNGQVVMADQAAGTSCGNGQVCDGAGNCGCSKTSDCGQAAACTSVSCQNQKCVVTNSNPETTCSSGGGKVCDGNGTCVGCVTGGDCTSGNCNATTHTCGPAANGHSCTGGNSCQSGHCVGGICCDHSCTGTCTACTMALTGKADGTCANVTAGTSAPNGQCTASACGNDGKCDGNGACEQIAAGTQCAAAACNGNTYFPAQVCASMSCPTATGTDCGTYKCATSGCPTSCGSDGDCAAGSYCQTPGATGTCVAQLANGATCTDGSQCTSGWCYGTTATCQANSCGDGTTDGAETDKDCGGGSYMGQTACAACALGLHCTQSSDCQSNNCKGQPGNKTCQ